MTEGNADDDIRVGHPERERAIELLNDAFAAGYLDVTEFEERSGSIYAARTRGELRVALADLPSADLLFPDAAAAAGATVVVASGDASQVQLDANWETVRRKGTWQVPMSTFVTGSMGTVDLDFRNATFPGPRIELHLQVSATSVKLKLGPAQDIDYRGLAVSGWTSIKDKAGPPSKPGGPTIAVTGSASAMSGVTIKRS